MSDSAQERKTESRNCVSGAKEGESARQWRECADDFADLLPFSLLKQNRLQAAV
jgi:hypothetical protein